MKQRSSIVLHSLVFALFVVIHLYGYAHWGIGGFAFDSGQYLSMISGEYSDLHPPGYSWLLAIAGALWRDPRAPYAANLLLSALSCCGVFWIWRRSASRVSSLAVALLYCFCTRTLLWSHWLLSESLYLAILLLQVAIHAHPDWMRRSSKRWLAAIGALWGLSIVVRSASVFLLPVVFVPTLCFAARAALRPGRRRALAASSARSAIVLAGIACVVAPVAIDVHRQTGQWSITQAGPWNLLYGHPETARCEPESATTPVHESFCTAFASIPVDVREFALAQRRGAPGEVLLRELGGFREAGPALQKIMLREAARDPGTFLRETWSNAGDLLTRSDRWYRPHHQHGGFVRDPKVAPLLERHFGPIPPVDPDEKPAWMIDGFYIPPPALALAWICLLAVCVSRRAPIHYLNAGIPAVVAGTALVAFGEPRYFAPVELLVFAVGGLQVELLARGRSAYSARSEPRDPDGERAGAVA